MRNPLSPFTYYIRHKGQALLLIGVVALVTLGVHTMIGMLDSGWEYIFYSFNYLTRLSRVSDEDDLSTEVAARIRAHPDAAHVIPENGMVIGIPGPGIPIHFPALGVRESDLPVVLEACNLRLKEGRLIEPRAAEIVLSAEIARTLDLQVGDSVSREIDENYYAGFVTDLTVVGILESTPSDAAPEVGAAFLPYEYLEGHELYSPRPSGLLVIAREGRKAALDSFLRALAADTGGSSRLRVTIYKDLLEELAPSQSISYGMYGFTDFLLAGTAMLAVAAINQIALARRLSDLGLLHALGNEKRHLIRRLALEVTAAAVGGWSVGLVCSLALSIWLNAALYPARGETMISIRLAPFLFTVPIPVTVVAFTALSIGRTLRQLDAVAVIERGKLSAERADSRRREARGSSRNPLSSRVFYLRHRHRGVLFFLAIAAMNLGVVFPAFVIATYIDGNVPVISYLRYASIVSPVQAGATIDPEIVAQIRAHPAAAHVIPAKPLNMMVNASAAVLGDTGMPIHAVRQEDMQTLLDAYHVHLGQGMLPDPHAGEIVLSHALALNRSLGVGDTVGQPVEERDDIPTELIVVGILEPNHTQLRSERARELSYAPQWIGFAPYEYVDGHEQYAALPTCFLVVSSPGRETKLEAWLEQVEDSSQVAVETFGATVKLGQEIVRALFAFLTVAEVILAAAAASALVVLQTIFFRQRRDEFGILHALGRSRSWLVWRALRESASVVSAAWIAGAVICAAGMLYFQFNVYAPIGLNLNLYNGWPWLFTLPIPVAVVAASVGTIAWALSRLDPVAVIERR